jgi:hypothetical protein
MTEKVYRTAIQVADNYPIVPNSDNMFHDVVASKLPEYSWTTIEASHPRHKKCDEYIRANKGLRGRFFNFKV